MSVMWSAYVIISYTMIRKKFYNQSRPNLKSQKSFEMKKKSVQASLQASMLPWNVLQLCLAFLCSDHCFCLLFGKLTKRNASTLSIVRLNFSLFPYSNFLYLFSSACSSLFQLFCCIRNYCCCCCCCCHKLEQRICNLRVPPFCFGLF